MTLRDRQTAATIIPFASRHQVPASLIIYLCDQINKEIEGGDTYPMIEPFTPHGFADYWFQNFGAVMLLGSIDTAAAILGADDAQQDWSRECLGSFYVKPNYPGRSSHVCNGGLLVTDASRNRGVGRLMGECYIDWAPRLGYTYSMFNLVYETNVASCKIWDALGFKRIGRVRGAGSLKSHPDGLVDGIIYGRDLVAGAGEDLVSEERFDKIKFYLKFGKYPNGADRAEKSRLRSAATHYKLLENDKLMLKDKEVISDPALQYEIARDVHNRIHHGGINKTTATIAEKYHWSRIKETVSDVIRACAECSKSLPNGNANNSNNNNNNNALGSRKNVALSQSHTPSNVSTPVGAAASTNTPSAFVPTYANPSDITVLPPIQTLLHSHDYQPIDPQIIQHSQETSADHNVFDHYNSHADFQALLTATGDDHHTGEADADVVDHDLDMLIDHHDDDAVE